MLTAVPKYPTTLNLPDKRNKKIHTINYNDKFFSVKILKNNIEKTTILSFTKKTDAIIVSAMLENHFVETKEWPENLLSQDSGLFLMSNDMNEFTRLAYLEISSWNFLKFNQFCVDNLIDYLLISDISKMNKETFNIKGQLITIADNEVLHCADILNKIYDKS